MINLKIKKAVITVAGLGTRLYPATKEMPKEMMPIPVYYKKELKIIPLCQLIFENLCKLGIEEIAFITNNKKRILENHFSNIDKATIYFINQPEPLGFGDAVLKAKNFIKNEDFILCAGDSLIWSPKNNHWHIMFEALKKYQYQNAIFLEYSFDWKHRGVIFGEELEKDIWKIKIIVEKPQKLRVKKGLKLPTSTAIYKLTPTIFRTLEKIKKKPLELTDGLQELLKDEKILGIALPEGSIYIDIGRPETYRKIWLKPIRA
jgi:UTP--glucose-1-phosphate uridylyltransferase